MTEREEIIPLGQLIIGLGTEGSRIADEVKRIIDTKLKDVPTAKFMAIDTDEGALAQLEHIPSGVEWRCFLARADPETLYRAAIWLPEKARPILSQQTGVGRCRAVIPVLLSVDRFELLKDRFGSVLEREFRARGIPVGVSFIACAGGGTGSGLLPHLIDYFSQRGDINPVMTAFVILPHERDDEIEKANAYALLKELSYMQEYVFHNRQKRIIVILLERRVREASKDKEIPRVIANFLVDFSYIRRGVQEQSNLNTFFDEVQRLKNSLCTIGSRTIRFPIEELQWFYKAEDSLQNYRKQLGEIKIRLEDEDKSLEEIKREIRDLASEYRVKRDASLENQRKRKENLLHNFTLRKLKDDALEVEEEFKKIRTELDERKAFLESLRYGSRIKEIEKKLNESLQPEIDDLGKRADICDENYSKLKERVKEINGKIDEFNRKILKAKEYLKSPPFEYAYYTIDLRDEDIDRLRGMKDELEKLSFREIMRILGRIKEFETLTTRVPEREMSFSLLMNYNYGAIEKRRKIIDTLPKELKDRLENRAYLEQGGALVVISTNRRNLEMEPIIDDNIFKITFGVHRVMKQPYYFPDESLRHRFDFIAYLIMGGLFLSSSEGFSYFPSVELFEKEYLKSSSSSEDIVLRHSALLPTCIMLPPDEEYPKYIGQLRNAGIITENVEGPKEIVESVTEYLRKYPLEGSIEAGNMVLHSLGIVRKELEEISVKISNTINSIETSLQEFRIPKEYRRRGLMQVNGSLEKVENQLREIQSILKTDAIDRWRKRIKNLHFFIEIIIPTISKEEVETINELIKGSKDEIEKLEKSISYIEDTVIEKIAKMLDSDEFNNFMQQCNLAIEKKEYTFQETQIFDNITKKEENIRTAKNEISNLADKFQESCRNLESDLESLHSIIKK